MPEEKKTKLGAFLSKAAVFVPDLINVVGSAVAGNPIGAIKQAGEILKREASKGEKEKELLIEFEQSKQDFIIEIFEAESKDRQHARENAEKGNNAELQKMLAYFSVFGFITFIIIHFFLIWQTMNNKEMNINEFVISGISSTQTLFTAILFTLKDYLFGGSVREEKK